MPLSVHLECLACLLRQAKSAPSRLPLDAQGAQRVVAELTARLSDPSRYSCAPGIGGVLGELLAFELGVEDPYLSAKRRANRTLLRLLPWMRQRVENSLRPFETAVRFAIAANLIDYGAPCGTSDEAIEQRLEESLCFPFGSASLAAIASLESACARATSILYLTDNAGEIVADRLLLELLPDGVATVAVRSAPTINDALSEDAVMAGLHAIARVVPSGSRIPGTLPEDCCEEVARLLDSADVVISKGQGNYETLSGCGRKVTHLLVVKCEVIAADLGCGLGELVVRCCE